MLSYRKLFTAMRTNFYSHIEWKFTVYLFQVEDSLFFATVVVLSSSSVDWMLIIIKAHGSIL